jgi:hypothetical protein
MKRGAVSKPVAARALAATAVVLANGLLPGGCGSTHNPPAAAPLRAALVREARPIGRGVRFHPPVAGPIAGPCAGRLGPRVGVHVELFASNRVVIMASGIGTRAPRTYSGGRISAARCYGALVTLEPTGVVLVRPHLRLFMSDLFRSWGQPLSSRRLASFAAPAGDRVRVFVDGRQWPGAPGRVALSAHREIVLELGPFVPPHSRYTFPPGA